MGVTSHLNAITFTDVKKTLETWPLNIRHKVHLSAHYRFHLLPGIDSFNTTILAETYSRFLVDSEKKRPNP